MGVPAWLTLRFSISIGLLLEFHTYNDGIEISIRIPFVTLWLNTYHPKNQKKEIFSYINY
jgi:hypothetical protein